MALRIIYAIFLGILLSTFVGVGINVFEKAPKYPDCVPNTPASISSDGSTIAAASKDLTCQPRIDDYQKKQDAYSRNVSISALLAAVVILVISLLLSNKINVIADGLLLGGVLTLMYGVGYGLVASNDAAYRFIAVSVGLVAALIIGYLKFVHKQEQAHS